MKTRALIAAVLAAALGSCQRPAFAQWAGGAWSGGGNGGGVPSGAAGGDLSGTYPDPSVVDDSHSHTASTIDDGGAAATFPLFSGAAGAPSFRAITLSDVPFSALGTGTADGTKFLRDDRTWTTVDLSPYALDALVVHKAGTETITGAKTFGQTSAATSGTLVPLSSSMTTSPSGASTATVYGGNFEVQSTGTFNLGTLFGLAGNAAVGGTGNVDNAIGLSFGSLATSGSAGTIAKQAGVDLTVATLSGSSANVTTVYGLNPFLLNQGSGTMGTVTGLNTTIWQAGAGGMTNTNGIVIGSTIRSAGTVTNNVGIKIEDQSGVGSTIHRNLWSKGASSDNLFEGAIAIGTATITNSLKLGVVGTLPSSPSAGAMGMNVAITSAGSAAQTQSAGVFSLGAGYTGAQLTAGVTTGNAALGTGTASNLNSTTNVGGNVGMLATSAAAGAGLRVGVAGQAGLSTGASIGVYGKANDAAAGTNYGGVFNASGSTEGTDPINVALLATLGSSLPTALNGSFAGYFDGGTLPNSNSNVLRVQGTLPASPSNTPAGAYFTMTGAGSGSVSEVAVQVDYNAGYTGSGATEALDFTNVNRSTGTTLTLNSTSAISTGNYGLSGAARGSSGAGINYGGFLEARNSTTTNIGAWGKAASAIDGNNIGLLGTAGASTEGTGLKNVAVLGTLGSSLPAVNINAAAIFDNGALAAPIVVYFDNGTEVARIGDGGTVEYKATTNIGWSVQAAANQACDTTCTNACVVGFATGTVGSDAERPVSCTDATADRCLCAGAS